MRAYIREHLRVIIIVTALIVCAGLGCATPVIIAKMQPVLSEELQVVSVELEQDIFEYTGEEIKPEITNIVFEDQESNRISKNADEFVIKEFTNNIEVGQADVEISMEGYQGTLVLKDIFKIKPASVEELQIVTATRELVELSWNETTGADGYLLFRSNNNGENYVLVKDIVKAEVETLGYQDIDIQYNAVYVYYVCAYALLDSETLLGDSSELVTYYTPLENPAISSVKCSSYNTLQIQWPVVAGAVGYQVYKGETQDGEFQCIEEIADGATTTYKDATCETGKTYYYYIKACQSVNSETIWGEASAVASGRTTPSGVSLSGSTTESNTKVNLSWKKVSSAQGYEVYKDGKLAKTIENADTLSWAESGLSDKSEATYKVRAYCVVNGEKIYGSYSKTYEKDVTINYDYSAVSSDVSVLTQYVGKTYKYGGTSVTNGWDCSGFTKYVFAKHFGVNLNRTTVEQAGQGTAVSKNDRSSWKPGDLLFYKENGRISHVAIYLGNGQMIHALNEKYDTLIQGVDYYEKWDSKTSLYSVRRLF